jgi:anion-transporting  ArsA/GET3 family ATPase
VRLRAGAGRRGTPEIAAFDEFIGLLAGDAEGYDHVVFDTAPTGHTLLLMDATGAYHRQLTQTCEGAGSGRVVTSMFGCRMPAARASCW